MELNVKRGLGETVFPGVIASLVGTRSFDGAEVTEAYVDAGNPDCLMVWEKWEGRPHQDASLNWRMETGMGEALADVVASPPRFTHPAPAE